MDIKVKQEYLERAVKLHKDNPVVDAHLDLAGELFFRVQNGEQDPLRRHYLEDLRTGGVNLLVSSVYLRDDQAAEGGLRAALCRERMLLRDMPVMDHDCRMDFVVTEDRVLEFGWFDLA